MMEVVFESDKTRGASRVRSRQGALDATVSKVEVHWLEMLKVWSALGGPYHAGGLRLSNGETSAGNE